MKKTLLPLVLTVTLMSFQLSMNAQVTNPEKTRVSLANTTYNAVVDDAEPAQPATQAGALVDGDAGTYWETSWQAGATPLPHWAVIDMKASQTIDGIYIIDRPNPGNSPYSIDVYTTNQSDTTGGATWEQQGTTWYPGYSAGGKLFFTFPSNKACQYLRLVITQNGGNSGNTNQVTNIAEIGAFQWSVADPYAYDRSGWSVVSFSSQDNNDPGVATSAIDNNPSSYWQSQWVEPVADFPHSIVIDMGTSIPVNKIGYSQRTGNYSSQVDSGTVAFSNDNASWTSEIPLKFTYHQLDGTNQWINLPAMQNARYMRLRMVRNYYDVQNPLETPSITNPTSVATSISELRAGYDAALPVTVYSFTGTLSGGLATLKWHSGVEENFKQYELESGTDGIHFNTAEVISARGSNNAYSVSLAQKDATVYYRLKLVDIDGTYSYGSHIIRLTQNLSGKILIYPNPANSFIRIDVPEKGIAKIYNGSGILMRTLNLESGSNRISVQELSRGVYYVLIGGHQLKFVKE